MFFPLLHFYTLSYCFKLFIFFVILSRSLLYFAAMAAPTISSSNPNSRQRKHFPLERRPRTLKDFLQDESNSCSSNGFKSFPRKACHDSSIGNLIGMDLNSGHANYGQRLQRSRSKAASTTISAFQAMINAVKNIHFAYSVKSPSILPRSLSRKLSKRNSVNAKLSVESKENEIEITVRVKDIIRWKSSRDLVEENSLPSDFAASPHHCTTITTTTTGSTCTPCSSNGSSWCDSDFTSEYLPSEGYGEIEFDVDGKKFSPCVGKDPMETTTETADNTVVGPKGRKSAIGEKEQNSPVLVLDFEYGKEDDKQSFPSFSQSLAIMERTKQNPIEKIQRFERLAKLESVSLEKWMLLEETGEDSEDGDDDDVEANEVEEKARQLLNRLKETSSVRSNESICTDKLILDLFREEIATKWNQPRNNKELEYDSTVGLAKAWINGELNETSTKLGVAEKREACIRDMDREGRWSCNKFEEEQEELGWEVESWVTNILVDELLVDLL